jgi:hypothetical protein
MDEKKMEQKIQVLLSRKIQTAPAELMQQSFAVWEKRVAAYRLTGNVSNGSEFPLYNSPTHFPKILLMELFRL